MHKVFRKDPITVEITGSVNTELQALALAERDIVNQTIIDTATWGLGLQERELGLITDTSKNFEIRRSVIKAKRRGSGKLDIALIKRTVESYTYADTEITFDGAIHIAFTSIYGRPPNMDDVYTTIENIKPAHIAVYYSFKYRTHDEIKKSGATHNQLATLTHIQIGQGNADFLPPVEG